MINQFKIFYPTKPLTVTQKFGETKYLDWYKEHGIDFKGHAGIDMLASHGQPVYAAHYGEVVYAGMDSNEGYGVVIRTTEPCQYAGGIAYMKSVYWHLIKDIPVKVGQKVDAGDIIGYADSTGLSSGDHLHFSIKPQMKGENDWTWMNIEQNNGYFGNIDASPYFNGMYSQDAQGIISTLRKIIELLKKILSQ
jgi:murein DD-endopeptidase MepM/ murein hydrolase activator NlpD